MNRKQIISMEAGREMDALVWQLLHDKPIDLTKCRYVDGDVQPHAGYPTGHVSPRPYSKNIHWAWQVVEKICVEAPEDCWTGPHFYLDYDGLRWEASFDYLDSIDMRHGGVYAVAPTAPLAICRAALLATLED